MRVVRTNPSKSAAKRYKQAHWGIPHTRIIDVPDADLPKELVEMGKLRELRLRSGNDWFQLEFPQTTHGNDCILAFSADKAERLYPILNRAAQRDALTLIVPSEPFLDIREVAEGAGGRQAKHEDRPVQVQPVGILYHVVYFTEKKGDGPSDYIHALGEETGIRPYLCVDARGRLHIVGGNYRVPNPGITD